MNHERQGTLNSGKTLSTGLLKLSTFFSSKSIFEYELGMLCYYEVRFIWEQNFLFYLQENHLSRFKKNYPLRLLYPKLFSLITCRNQMSI